MKAKPSLLFLPGLLCDGELWAHPMAALSDLVDAKVADFTRDDTIAGMARRAAATQDGPFIVVALSMGGYVAFELLRAMPERIQAVALLDTSAAPDTPEKSAERRAGIASLSMGRFSGVTNRLLPQLVHPDHVNGPVGAAVKAMAERVGSDAYIRQQHAILGRIDSRPGLPSINVPALVMVGSDDRLTPPAEARTIHEGIAGSRFVIVEHCGHLPPMEKPEETSQALQQWLLETVL